MNEYWLLSISACGAFAFIVYLLGANNSYAKSDESLRATINDAIEQQRKAREEFTVEKTDILNAICIDPALTYIAHGTQILKYKSGNKVFTLWLDKHVLAECRDLVKKWGDK